MSDYIASATHGTRHVFIRNLELPAHIGVYRNEEGRTQQVRINLDLATDDIADAQDMLEIDRQWERIKPYMNTKI